MSQIAFEYNKGEMVVRNEKNKVVFKIVNNLSTLFGISKRNFLINCYLKNMDEETNKKGVGKKTKEEILNGIWKSKYEIPIPYQYVTKKENIDELVKYVDLSKRDQKKYLDENFRFYPKKIAKYYSIAVHMNFVTFTKICQYCGLDENTATDFYIIFKDYPEYEVKITKTKYKNKMGKKIFFFALIGKRCDNEEIFEDKPNSVILDRWVNKSRSTEKIKLEFPVIYL